MALNIENTPLIHLPLDEIRDKKLVNIGRESFKDKFEISQVAKGEVHYDGYIGAMLSVPIDEKIRITVNRLVITPGITINFWNNFKPTVDGKSSIFKISALQMDIELTVDKNQLQLSFLDRSKQNDPGVVYTTITSFSPNKWNFFSLVINDSYAVEAFYINAIPQAVQNVRSSNLFKSETNVQFLLNENTVTFEGRNCYSNLTIYSEKLQQQDLILLMERSLNLNARFKQTFPLDFKMATVSEEEEVAAIYMADPSENSKNKFKIDVLNTSNQPIYFSDKTGKPGESVYHFQLRFKTGILSSKLIKNETVLEIGNWSYCIGYDKTSNEEFVSFLRTSNKNLPIKTVEFIEIPVLVADQNNAARNTNLEVRYANLRFGQSQLEKDQLSGVLTKNLGVVNASGISRIPFKLVQETTYSEHLRLKLFNSTIKPIVLRGHGQTNQQITTFEINLEALPIEVMDEFIVYKSSNNGLKRINQSSNQKRYNKKTYKISLVDRETILLPGQYLLFDFLNVKFEDTYRSLRKADSIAWLSYSNVPEYKDNKVDALVSVKNSGESEGRSVKVIDVDLNNSWFGDTFDMQTSVSVKNEWIDENFKQRGISYLFEGRIKDQTGFLMPVGSVIAFAGKKIPEGWELCDGRTIPNNPKYATLKTILGSSTFPDLVGLFVKGTKSPEEIGKGGGSEEIKIEEDNLPPHNHTLYYETKNWENVNIEERYKQGWPAKGFKGVYATDRNASSGSGAMDKTGKGVPIKHSPKHLAMYYIIKY